MAANVITLYVTSTNFNALTVIINLLLAKQHCKNILKRPIARNKHGSQWYFILFHAKLWRHTLHLASLSKVSVNLA